MTKTLNIGLVFGAMSLLASSMTLAADVVAIGELGEDGDESYYQVTCSNNTRASVMVQKEPAQICAHPPVNGVTCKPKWTVSQAAAEACK